MQIEIKIDPSCTQPKLVVLTDKMTDEIQAIVAKLTEETPQVLCGFCDDMLEILDQADILRVFAAAGKIFAVTAQCEYKLRQRLYELEGRLDKDKFVRISNSEIINLKKVKGFDLSFVGTICVTLSNGAVTYVSQRYVAKVKKVLGI